MERGIDVTGPITPEQQTAVETLLRQRNLPARQRERLEMVKASWLGTEVDAIARWSGRTPRTVRRWLAAFRDGGVEALAGAPIPGRPPKADAADLGALEAALDTPPRTLNLPFDVWSSQRLSAYL
ncbi:MAG: helix-turn-helix domain-containing protein, partial [Thermomicrobiales bacterium]|nr:helix-turn-helix domain-containing protein [Thermomicrobiales bacterium]